MWLSSSTFDTAESTVVIWPVGCGVTPIRLEQIALRSAGKKNEIRQKN
jgi:hypothetical protein